jgi:hypothetical protein
MALIANPYKCDVCSRPKGEGNGWLLGIIIASLHHQPLYLPTARDPQALECPDVKGYAIIEWEDEVAPYSNPNVHHLCSEQCALTKQAEYLRRSPSHGEDTDV